MNLPKNDPKRHNEPSSCEHLRADEYADCELVIDGAKFRSCWRAECSQPVSAAFRAWRKNEREDEAQRRRNERARDADLRWRVRIAKREAFEASPEGQAKLERKRKREAASARRRAQERRELIAHWFKIAAVCRVRFTQSDRYVHRVETTDAGPRIVSEQIPNSSFWWVSGRERLPCAARRIGTRRWCGR